MVKVGSRVLARPRRVSASVVALSILAAVPSACMAGGDKKEPATKAGETQPGAGRWKTWVLSSGDEIQVPAPPKEGSSKAEADHDEVEKAVQNLSGGDQKTIKKWDDAMPTYPWMELAFDYVSQESKNPPLSSRNYALVSIAMYDAIVSAWHWKYQYDVKPPGGIETFAEPGPDPSYPSEHAAIAGAASRVLAHLYPRQSALRLDEMAEQAAGSRLKAGVNTPSDVDAGLELGRKVADKVIAYSKTDGAGRQWDGKRPPGIGGGPEYWEPAPGVVSPPIEPLGGTWKTWVMKSADQFRPPPPPPYGSPEFRRQAQELIEMKKNLTPKQKEIAKYWEGAEGTSLPAGIVNTTYAKDIREAAEAKGDKHFTVPETARAFTLLNVAMADGGVAVWEAKYFYWYPRPENSINDLGLEKGWQPFLPTPRFPAYPSGSAGYAGGAQTVMSYLFPEKAAEFEERAREHAESRLLGGIHWRADSISLEGGRKIGDLVVDWAKKDGSPG